MIHALYLLLAFTMLAIGAGMASNRNRLTKPLPPGHDAVMLVVRKAYKLCDSAPYIDREKMRTSSITLSWSGNAWQVQGLRDALEEYEKAKVAAVRETEA